VLTNKKHVSRGKNQAIESKKDQQGTEDELRGFRSDYYKYTQPQPREALFADTASNGP
jgi:hypothetical protein